MALITRVSRLFRADLHAVLDRIEEPATLLRQAIREMEEQLAADQRQLSSLDHDRSLLVSREHELARSTSELAEELDVCFEAGQDDLSRALIKRKLEYQRQSKQLASRLVEITHALEGYKIRTEENRARLEHMRRKAELLVDEEDHRFPGNERSQLDPSQEHMVTSEDIEVAFLREKQRRMRS